MTNNHSDITTDFLIIGGGIIGLNIARELKKRHQDCRVIILEKESHLGEHASGRNSGVLHAGFYYTKDSLKAKFTKHGNAALTEYCLDKKLPINRCGKLVVARNQADLAGLDELLHRGKINGIALDVVSEKEAREIEPRVKTFEKALFSPTTSSVDPKLVLQEMQKDALAEGIEIHFGTQYLGYKNQRVLTNRDRYSCGYIVNTAGLYADKVAKHFGFSSHYAILPFKGLYLYASNPAETFRTNIYPVPALQNPFLGVHFTVSVSGAVKIGPTAIPAFWREQYQGISKFNARELLEVTRRELTLLLRAGFDFRKLAWSELLKYNRRVLVNHASELAHNIHKNNYCKWGKPGIRAQLVNTETRKLEMDFILEGNNKSFHVLNAVSPAFTCSIPFAKYTVDHIEAQLR